MFYLFFVVFYFHFSLTTQLCKGSQFWKFLLLIILDQRKKGSRGKQNISEKILLCENIKEIRLLLHCESIFDGCNWKNEYQIGFLKWKTETSAFKCVHSFKKWTSLISKTAAAWVSGAKWSKLAFQTIVARMGLLIRTLRFGCSFFLFLH